jgi:hypothetical protein
VYSADLRKHYDLKDPAWRYDIMPEVIDGHNVADFIDPDIDAKLAELEREEAELEEQHQAEVGLLAPCCAAAQLQMFWTDQVYCPCATADVLDRSGVLPLRNCRCFGQIRCTALALL